MQVEGKPVAPESQLPHDKQYLKDHYEKVPRPGARPPFSKDSYALGAGRFGKVTLCRDRQTHELVAVKKQGPRVTASSSSATGRFELAVNQAIHSRYVLPITDWAMHELKDTLYLVSRYVPRSLEAELAQYPMDVPTERRGKEILVDLLAGIEACHQAGYCHNDVRRQNVLIDQDGTAMLIDLGYAQPYSEVGAQYDVGRACLIFQGIMGYLWNSGLSPECRDFCAWIDPHDLAEPRGRPIAELRLHPYLRDVLQERHVG